MPIAVASACLNLVCWSQASGDGLLFNGQHGAPAGFPDGDEAFTVGFWARTSNSLRGGALNWGGAALMLDGARNFTLDLGAAQLPLFCELQGVQAGFDAGEWHHYAARYTGAGAGQDSRVLSLLVDGVQCGSSSLSAPLALAAEDFAVGSAHLRGQWQPLRGTLDDVFVADAALSSQQMEDVLLGQFDSVHDFTGTVRPRSLPLSPLLDLTLIVWSVCLQVPRAL
jgi:hypothetical protein